MSTADHNSGVAVGLRLILHSHVHQYQSLIGTHLRRCDKDTILGNVKCGHCFEPHMTVDAGTAVPAAVGLFGVIDFYDNLVFAFFLIKIRCYINGERGVAIVMLSSLLAIHIDLGLLINALEEELDEIAIRRLECLAVLALACLEPSSASSRCSLARIGPFEDVPVVRQVNSLRFPIVSKLPAEVKQLSLCLCRCRRHYYGQHHCNQFFLHNLVYHITKHIKSMGKDGANQLSALF